MIKRILLPIVFLLIAAGCAAPVRSTISPQFAQVRPRTVAILPVIRESGSGEDFNEVAYLFRKMSGERLTNLGYKPLPLEEVDDKYTRLGSAYFASHTEAEAALALGADAVLQIRMKEWVRSVLATYIALSVDAEFELHSGGGKLWDARYRTKESDLRLDTVSLNYALLKAYEPRVQRLVDAVFSTLPKAEKKGEAKKTYFQWLP